MATVEDVERLCLALPEVAERTSWGNRAWFVEKAMFCWVRPFSKADLRRFGDDPVPQGEIVGLRTEDLAERDAILGEGVPGFFTIEHLVNHPGFLVELDLVDPARLETAVEDAWLARAPARLAESWLAERP
ncbi:MAG: hypothetical protein EON53_03735 [Actinomycetales bacterium]|nr:MAG: hypothetical protein EON53_03735 [Actinomycetales bacterium]